nr:uncharacterized protein LOC125419774 isoform X2 [Ziziphus jujuba var. spinosa]
MTYYPSLQPRDSTFIHFHFILIFYFHAESDPYLRIIEITSFVFAFLPTKTLFLRPRPYRKWRERSRPPPSKIKAWQRQNSHATPTTVVVVVICRRQGNGQKSKKRSHHNLPRMRPKSLTIGELMPMNRTSNNDVIPHGSPLFSPHHFRSTYVHDHL